MKKNKNLTPELRFPEFEDNWNVVPLGEKVQLISGFAFKSKDMSSLHSDLPILRGINITEGRIRHNTDIDRFYQGSLKGLEKYMLKANDLVIGMDGSKVGKNVALISDNDSGSLLIQRVARLRTADKSTIQVIFQQVNSTLFHNYVDKINTSGGIPHISAKQINEFLLSIPQSSKEKQKIADCLSSLDDLIEAHQDKLEALKKHKKGLLQNLFPQEGQKVPNYRFPEFEHDGEWEFKSFSQFIKLFRGSSPRPIKEYLTKNQNGVNWIKIGDTSAVQDYTIKGVSEKITKDGALKSRKVKKGELILANSMSYGKTYQLEIDGCIYDGWFVLRDYEKYLDKGYLLHLLNSTYMQEQYEKFAAGGIVQNISSEIVYNTMIPRTSIEEQQKIASCLSEVDNLIITESDKIAQLQQHKKGLMQGLFPKIDN